ncbi:MAG: beta-hydroxyacyl-ACP dehydratase [Deltaproteobacteria bacterium]|jgi:3-hydroxyacyl-[acyl-carrier-protein] dehydratase|nr:beta-hydroxyacyl-ACP dehydratase [Deltaproteobacteria bacterium]
MAADRETMDQILNSVPQQSPFRFIDNILELDEEHIVGTYRFREDEYFYRGHFPGRPITPGVILIETMAQTGVVAFGLYLKMMQARTTLEATKDMITLFTLVEGVEFTGMVQPGERLIIRGQKMHFRMGSLKSKVTVERENGEMVSFGTLAGMGFFYGG